MSSLLKPFVPVLLSLIALRAIAAEPASAFVTPGEVNAGPRMNDDWFIASHDARWAAFGTSLGFGVLDTRTGKKIGGGEGWRLYDASAWSPAGDVLAFVAHEKGAEALHLWTADTSRERELLAYPERMALTSLAWSPDGGTLYAVLDLELPKPKLLARDDNPTTVSKNVILSLSSSFGKPSDPPPFESAPGAYAESTRSLVLAVAVASGSVRLVCEGNDIDSLYPSPDGKEIAFVQSKTSPHGDDLGTRWTRQAHADVYVIPAAAPAGALPVDLGSFDDPTAGWWDAAHQAMEPALRDLLLNSSVDNDGHRRPHALAWSPDGSRFAWATTGRQSTGDIFVYDTVRKGTVNLTETVTLPSGAKGLGYGDNYTSREKSPKFGGLFPPLWLADGQALVAVAHGDAWLVPLDPQQQARNLTSSLDEETRRILSRFDGNVAAIDPSGAICLIAKDKASRADSLWKVNAGSASLSRLCDTGQWIGRYGCVSPSVERLLYAGQSDTVDTNLFGLALAPGSVPANLTGFKPELANLPFPEHKLLAWKTSWGAPAYGVLYLPSGASATHPVPLVLVGHPGWPVSRVDECESAGPRALGRETLDFLNQGLAVFYPDLPMSDLGVYDHPMKQIVGGVNAAADAAVATGLVDAGRLGIMGGGDAGSSYGGYMVEALVTQTDRFKAAVSISGVADWLTDYLGEGSLGPNYEEVGEARMGGPIWQDPSRYVENSPFSYVGNVNTPILYIHGYRDPVTPLDYDVKNWEALGYVHKRFVIYSEVKRDGLEPSQEQRIRPHLWFAEHLLGAKARAQAGAIPGFFLRGDRADTTEATALPSSLSLQ